jgi:hypothetical protein
MLNITYSGWFQYRAALDPDPIDEPRGVSGPTFAVAGEPPFDGFIRYQNAVAPRYPHDKDHGVFVTAVDIDGQPQPYHPLIGAAVDLLDKPRYEERGYIVTYQQVPIDPYHLQISGNGITIRRKDCWDVTQPDLRMYEVSKYHPELIPRRQCTISPQSVKVAEATGIMDYAAYRRQRRADLTRMLKSARGDINRMALQKRIEDLAKDDQGMTGLTVAAQQFLGLCADYAFDVNGPMVIADKQNELRGVVGTSQIWPLRFWMGGFDVDSLFGYVSGVWQLPFKPDPPAKKGK